MVVYGKRPEALSNGFTLINVPEDLFVLQGADLYLEVWGGHPGTANKRFIVNGKQIYPLGDDGTEEENWAPEIYACEDKEAISEVLGQQYHAVVGNPPYIPVRDRVLNTAYRARYSACSGKYSLSVPFAERFFDLASGIAGGARGYVGQITSNSFMKRETIFLKFCRLII